MLRLLSLLLVIVCSLSLSACDETCPIAWSPDGSTMTFNAQDGLRLADANGKLSEPLLKNVVEALWLNDSHHMLVITIKELKDWEQIKMFLTEEQQEVVTKHSQRLKERILADQYFSPSPDYTGDATAEENMSQEVGKMTWIYLKQNQDLNLKKKNEPQLKSHLEEANCFHYQLSKLDVSDNQIKNRKELWHGFSSVKDLRIAPDKKAALLVTGDAWSSKINLIYLISLDYLREPIAIAESICDHADWSNDSRAIYLVQPKDYQNSSSMFGSISTLPVRDKEGYPIKNTEEPRPLVFSVISSGMDIAALRDKEILFTAAGAELPATEFDIKRTKNIFALRLGQQVPRRLTSTDEAEELKDVTNIRANQDGTWVAACNTSEGILHLINIETGEIIKCQTDHNFIPAWRNSDEVCFIKEKDKQPANRHVSEVVLLSVSTKRERVISDSWPDKAVKGPLTNKK